MIKYNEPRKFTAPNAWGRDGTNMRQAFVVEASDIGKPRKDYGGQGQRAYTFKAEDVGRVIEVMTSPGYHSWYFGSVFTDVPSRIEQDKPVTDINDLFPESDCPLCHDVKHIAVSDPVDADIETIPCPNCTEAKE